jgi:hypothetical protein
MWALAASTSDAWQCSRTQAAAKQQSQQQQYGQA